MSPEPSGQLLTVIKNKYLRQTEWGWPIDPIGLRITLNHIYDRYHLADLHLREWLRHV